MSRASRTLRQLERQAARRNVIDTFALRERERLEAMTDGQLLRHLARLGHRWADGPTGGPFVENYRVAEVDALIEAGDLNGAWAFLQGHVAK